MPVDCCGRGGTSGGVISFRIPRGFLGIGEENGWLIKGSYERDYMRKARKDPAGSRGRKSG